MEGAGQIMVGAADRAAGGQWWGELKSSKVLFLSLTCFAQVGPGPFHSSEIKTNTSSLTTLCWGWFDRSG
jgi:hypothetical protein